MKVCFPVQDDEGIESRVFGHFGSAPLFVVIDTTTNTPKVISNGDRIHQHGACNPLKALDGQQVDAVVAGGIGPGALSRLNQNGIRVFRAAAPTVRENLALLAAKELPEYAHQACCGGHVRGSGCAHS